MRKSHFTEKQMPKILRESDCSPVAGESKKHEGSEQTIYTWRKRFGTMNADEVKLHRASIGSVPGERGGCGTRLFCRCPASGHGGV